MNRPLLVLLSLAAVLFGGCHRSVYRQKADQEAYSLIAEKSNHPHWTLDRISIEPNPQSRMAPFGNPDAPPMPPDDPAAHQYMHVVDDKHGYPFWDINGHTQFVENPNWKSCLPVDEDGVLRVSADDAFELAMIHSTDFQRAWEQLYLSALDVSAERFVFDTQFFAGHQTNYDALGRLAPGSASDEGPRRSILNLSTRNEQPPRTTQAQRAFTTGASMVVGLANSLIWQFSGTDSHSASTLLNFSLVQPLLARAGRDRIMETLTLSERTLLANVRQMERFRRGFYTNLILGAGDQDAPQRRGGLFGESGFGGFTGVGSGGFGGLGGGGGFGGGGQGAGAGNARGFLGLLQTQQNIRNQEANITSLRISLTQLEAMYLAGRIEFIQVEQTRQDLFQNTSELLTAKQTYQNTLDDFKRDLGLPPRTPMVIEDDTLDQFQLIDPKIVSLQDQLAVILYDVGRANLAILDLMESEDPAFAWTATLAEKLKSLRADLLRTNSIRETMLATTLNDAAEDVRKLRMAIPSRRVFAADMAQRSIQARESGEDSLLADIDPRLFETSELEALPAQLDAQIKRVREQVVTDQANMDAIVERIDRLLELGPGLQVEQLTTAVQTGVMAAATSALKELEKDLLDISLAAAQARAESITLKPIDLDAETAVDVARVFRRDWMNARAALVDAWRLIEFNADDLESFLDVVFSGDIRNTGDNPLRLRDVTGSLGVGVRFDAPLTRLVERNRYRESLIGYQQSRRAYYQVEDGVSQTMRAILRQVELNKVNFELRRNALKVAVRQVQAARYKLLEPPPAQAQGQQGSASANNQTLALNLLNSFNSLRSAQDNFMSVWVIYEVQRGLLDLEMGTMRLDEKGKWVDPGPIGPKHGYPAEEDFRNVQFQCDHYPSFTLPEAWRSKAEGEDVPTPAPENPEGASEGELSPPMTTQDATAATRRRGAPREQGIRAGNLENARQNEQFAEERSVLIEHVSPASFEQSAVVEPRNTAAAAGFHSRTPGIDRDRLRR